MKIFHISDLHIGKQLNYYNLKKNQEAVLEEIIGKMEEGRPDVLLIAGDVFDKSMPSGEAYRLFDHFLNRVAEIRPQIPVCIIGGNHDSPERLSYASGFMEKHQIYISVMPPQDEGEYLKKITLEDEFGPVTIYFLPFTKPGYVRHLFPDREISSYEAAVAAILERESIDWKQRNILISHQFYQSQGWETKTCESEQVTVSVGGLDRIDTSVIQNFDYAALGHLHGPQQIKEPHIRYSGSPLKYSVSEEHQKKSVTMVRLKRKGEAPEIELLPLSALQDVRSIRGRLSELIAQAEEKKRHDFVKVTVTDENEPYRMKEQLQEVYDFLLEIQVDNARTRERLKDSGETYQSLRPDEAFRVFYEDILKEPMGMKEEERIAELLNGLMEDEE